MLKRFLVLFVAMVFVCTPLFSADAQENLQKELDSLKKRVEQLEEKIKEQEQSVAQDEETQKEHRKELAAIWEVL